MQRSSRVKWLPLTLGILMGLLFVLLFFVDNKYQTPAPYGQNGVLSLSQADLERSAPLFLIDGWLLTDAKVENLPTYIGEYPSLQRGNRAVSPHGQAHYQLVLRYSGEPIEVLLRFPQLYTDHVVSIDETPLSQGSGSALVSFTLTPGDHLLSVQTVSTHGYYSGMYHPAALGKAETAFHSLLIQCIAYGLACFLPLALALFTLALWRRTKDQISFWFGLLCCCFSFYLLYFFVRLLSLPLAGSWYGVQSIALYGLCFCTVRLAALSGGVATSGPLYYIQRSLVVASALLLGLTLCIQITPYSVWLHGMLTDLFLLGTVCAVGLVVVLGRENTTLEQRFTQSACICFGMGLLCNLFFTDLFEPILLFWQFEWSGLLLVLLFAMMMVARNQRILTENEALQHHLEELVDRRTAELSNLLRERKAFFADMAHDLKAPIFAAGSFIEAIREHNTAVDGELLRYIDLVDQKQQEMARRVQGLNELNRVDAISQPFEVISVHALLQEVYQTHRMAAEVQSVHLMLEIPEPDGNLYAQRHKLEILFENLIFNALRATLPEGKITLVAEIEGAFCHLSVSDTGSGIAEADLPHIFERFYVGANSKGTGSGLGLYIVKSIVEELRGEIFVSTGQNQGTVFFIDLPLIHEPSPSETEA